MDNSAVGATAVKQSPLDAALDGLRARIDGLSNTISLLSSKLNPVTNAYPMEQPDVSVDRPPSSRIVNEITNSANDVAMISSLVNQLIEQLEV